MNEKSPWPRGTVKTTSLLRFLSPERVQRMIALPTLIKPTANP